MIVRIGHAWMPIIVVDVNVVHSCWRAVEESEGLAGSEIPEREHIDRAHQIPLPVIG
jgi:hypothetical protein